MIAPFASASIAFVAASCGKGDSAVPTIINTDASRIEIPADENTGTDSASTVENSGSTGESSTIENNTNSTTSNDDNTQEAPKNNDLNTQTSPNTDEMEIVGTYKLNNINDMSPRDESSIKENIVEVPSITPEEAKKLRKKLEDIWKKHKYGFASFHTFDDVLKQLRVYVGDEISKFLNLTNGDIANDLINKNNPKKIIDLSIGDEKFTLRFGDIKDTVPTVYSYKGEDNSQFYVYGTQSKDFNITNSKKIVINQLGYYKDSKGDFFKVVTVPKNTVEVPMTLPLKVNSLAETFKELKEKEVTNLDKWDTKNIISLLSTFDGASNFNQSLESWNTENVKNMTSVFADAKSFNSSLSNWKTDSVTSMEDMFAGAESFNQDISKWNTKNVTDMSRMFWAATSFNSKLGNWNVSNVKSMERMFADAHNFNQDISGWNVENVQSMYGMFGGAKSFDQDISSWKLFDNVYYQDFTNRDSALNHDHLPPKFKTPSNRSR